MDRGVEFSNTFLKEARAAFEYSLSNFLWKQAVFFAERLVAECPCDETTYLLALAFFHNKETSRAHWHLQGCRSPEARYLRARCCLQLQKWEEAEDALILGPPGCNGGAVEVANGAAGLLLLGQVREKQSRMEQAIECYSKCLELCPFMWEAYQRWSWLILGSPSVSRASVAGTAARIFTDEKFSQSCSAMHGLARLQPQAAAQGHPATSQRSVTARAQRRSAGDPAVRQGGGGSNGSTAPGPGLSSREPRDFAQSRTQAVGVGSDPRGSGGGFDAAGETSLACLLCKLGTALHAMHGFETSRAIQLLQAVPRRHRETGFVLDMVGLCYLESNNYKEAEHVFKQVRRIEPRRVEGLEYYSTALWHLGQDLELGHLAQQCLQWDQMSPQVWCVVGNCFSRQKEHDVAIKFFKRAIQVDPFFTYAYTLCGHEFVANEKFDKAVPMYEHALGIDPRHYNAWWGLGNIHHRQEEHESARTHFMKALDINKSNSVLRCFLGMVLDALSEPLMALQNFDRAVQCEPQNGMAYFLKGCVFMSLERYEEALADLRKVITLAPKDAAVHFQLGKVYMKLQQDQKALIHFNTAMDLNRDSKDYHTIKTHIEQLRICDARDAEADVAGRRGSRRHHGGAPSSASGNHRDQSRAAVGALERPEHQQQFFPGAFSAGPYSQAGHGVASSVAHAASSPQPVRAIHWHSASLAAGNSPGRRGAAEGVPPGTPAGAGPQTPGPARGPADVGMAVPVGARNPWSGGGGRGGPQPGAAVHAAASRGMAATPTSWGSPGPAAPAPGSYSNHGM